MKLSVIVPAVILAISVAAPASAGHHASHSNGSRGSHSVKASASASVHSSTAKPVKISHEHLAVSTGGEETPGAMLPLNYDPNSKAVAPGPQSLTSCANPQATICIDARGYIVHVRTY